MPIHDYSYKKPHHVLFKICRQFKSWISVNSLIHGCGHLRMCIRAPVTTWRPVNISRDLRKISNIFHLLYYHIKILECGFIVKHHPVVLLNNG